MSRRHAEKGLPGLLSDEAAPFAAETIELCVYEPHATLKRTATVTAHLPSLTATSPPTAARPWHSPKEPW